MAYYMTYDSLFSNIQRFLERADINFLETIPLFIRFGQDMIARDMKTLEMVQELEGVMAPSNNVIVKPTGWRQSLSWEIGTGTDFTTYVPLELRTSEYLRQLIPDQASTVGQPKYFADYGTEGREWLIVPSPNLAYPYKIKIMATVPYIDETLQTNILTQYAPDLLLYACLLQTPMYVKDDGRLGGWQTLYDKALAGFQREDVERKRTLFSDLRRV